MARSIKSMPGPKVWPIVGSSLEYHKLFGKHTHDLLHIAKKERYKLFGKIHKEVLGPFTVVQVYDPADFETIFRADDKMPRRPLLPVVTSAVKREGMSAGLGNTNDDEWYNLRRAVQKPMMHPRAASVYLPAQNAVADEFLDLIDRLRNDTNEIEDFNNVLYRYAMESIGTVCFNQRLGCLQEKIELGSETDQIISSIREALHAINKTTFAFPWHLLWKTPMYKQYVRAKTTVNEISYTHIQSAVKTDKCPIAELQRSYATGDTDDDGPNFLLTLTKTQGLESKDIIGLVTDLFASGIDSTANALSFVLYNLAKSPESQQKLLQEIEEVMPDGEVTSEALDRMSYMKSCVKESFRLNFPVEGGTTRIPTKDLVLRGYEIPKGTIIAMNNQTICRESEYFDDPDEFVPERWMRSAGGQGGRRPVPNFVMLPFGYGPRMCIGRRFAEQEIYLAMIKIVKKYKLVYHHEPIGMINRLFTAPDKPLKIEMIPR